MKHRLGVLAAVALGLLFPACRKQAPPAPPPAPTVLVAPVERRDVPVTNEYVSALDGYVNAEIRARVPGFLEGQHYQEGSMVQEGQLLFTIDPRQYEAGLAEARGALARAEASLANARVTVRRLRPLARQQAVSQQDLDNALAAQQSALAQVASARAQVEAAELNLSYTRVRSPISGLAGRALVRMGNLVGQGQPTLLTTVSQVDPMRVDFAVTEREYLRYRARNVAPDGGAPPSPPNMAVQLVLADGSRYPYPGRLLFTSREVDPATGTLQLQAVFPNPQHLLRPGQFGRVQLITETLKGALLVPQRAVNELQGLAQVGVVGPDDVVHVRSVTLGPTSGSTFVVEEGLKEGERVIVAGLQKVKDGQKVTPRPAPPEALAPDGGTAGVGGAGSAGGAPQAPRQAPSQAPPPGPQPAPPPAPPPAPRRPDAGR